MPKLIDATQLKIGSTSVSRAFLGNTRVWPLWSPSEISTVFWYDPSDASTITASGTQVTQVLDKSGNNRTLTRDGANPGPLTGTRTLNGRNVFAWTGNNCLDNNSFTYSQSTTPLNIAIIARFDAASASGSFLLAGTNSSTTGQRMSLRLNASNIFEILGGSSAGVNQTLPSGTISNRDQAHLLLPRFNGPQSLWRVNGTQRNSGNVGTNSFTTMQFGHNETEGLDMTGFIAEIVAFASNSNAEIVEGYLAWKWGLQSSLPAGHPYKNSAPV
jgi:hypothetical protein